MRKVFKLLLAACFVTGIAAFNTSPYLLSLYEEIENLALTLVPDKIEQLVATLSEKLA